MYSEQLEARQRKWAEQGLMVARKLLPLMAPISGHARWQPEERRTIGYLASATARASESAFLLCAYGQLWDAEVLVRSAMEGTLKFAYLLQALDAFPDRHREYARELFDIGLLKGHRRAEEVIATAQDPQDAEWQPIRDLLLSRDELAELKARYGRTRKRELERRWGFTGLVSELVGSGDPLFRDVGSLAHAYSMASHVQHADMVGASIPLDRDRRSAERREAIHLAHLGRLVTDLLSLLYLRLAVGYRFVGADPSPLLGAKAMVEAASRRGRDAYGAWMGVEYRDSEP